MGIGVIGITAGTGTIAVTGITVATGITAIIGAGTTAGATAITAGIGRIGSGRSTERRPQADSPEVSTHPRPWLRAAACGVNWPSSV
jgi:hypothetical protein